MLYWSRYQQKAWGKIAMFGKMMKNYYYGKSGKGDYTKDDLPRNRWQLFWEMLRVRLSGLCRLNLMTIVAWLPTIILVGHLITSYVSIMNVDLAYTDYLKNGALTEGFGEEQVALLQAEGITDQPTLDMFVSGMFHALVMQVCLLAIPCIAITGPVQAGMAYVTRNWSRDEHAFIWSDFKDAVKENWKQGLGVSLITSVMPLIIYVCYRFYGEKAGESLIFLVPQMLTVTLGAVWLLGVTFMYPMMVTYQVTFRQLIKNSLMLAVGRLPQTVGVRLVLLLPAVLLIVIFNLTAHMIPLLLLACYYFLLGNAMARFVIASYTNAVFDRFINPRLEGVQVNRGLASEEDLDDGEEDDSPQA